MSKGHTKPNPRRPTASTTPISMEPVAFMDDRDVGKFFVPGSQREGVKLKPNYAIEEDGVDTVKVLMATDDLICFEAFRPRGAIDTAHRHPDHHSMVYQKQGRVRMRIGDEEFVVQTGDTYLHPLGVLHQHEALEDSVRVETKIFPKGGAIAAWNKLVGGSE